MKSSRVIMGKLYLADDDLRGHPCARVELAEVPVGARLGEGEPAGARRVRVLGRGEPDVEGAGLRVRPRPRRGGVVDLIVVDEPDRRALLDRERVGLEVEGLDVDLRGRRGL